MQRILMGFIALVLLLMAVLPLFGFNLILVLDLLFFSHSTRRWSRSTYSLVVPLAWQQQPFLQSISCAIGGL